MCDTLMEWVVNCNKCRQVQILIRTLLSKPNRKRSLYWANQSQVAEAFHGCLWLDQYSDILELKAAMACLGCLWLAGPATASWQDHSWVWTRIWTCLHSSLLHSSSINHLWRSVWPPLYWAICYVEFCPHSSVILMKLLYFAWNQSMTECTPVHRSDHTILWSDGKVYGPSHSISQNSWHLPSTGPGVTPDSSCHIVSREGGDRWPRCALIAHRLVLPPHCQGDTNRKPLPEESSILHRHCVTP